MGEVALVLLRGAQEPRGLTGWARGAGSMGSGPGKVENQTWFLGAQGQRVRHKGTSEKFVLMECLPLRNVNPTSSPILNLCPMVTTISGSRGHPRAGT